MAAAIPDIPGPIDAVTDPVRSLVGDGLEAVARAIMRSFGQAVVSGLADAAGRVTQGVLSFLDAASGIHLDSGWWEGERTRAVLGVVGALSVTLLVGFCFLALLQGMLAGDPGAMVRAVIREVPISVAGMALLVGITALLLALTDAASGAVLRGTPTDVRAFLGGLSSPATVSTNGLLGVVVMGVFLVGALLVWIELLVRSALIYLLLAFAPLTLAARVWPSARGAFRRLAELGLALIVSKFAIALALALGAAALAGGGSQTGSTSAEAVGLSLSGLLGGASLMALAAFTPFVMLRLLPVVEAAVVAQGISRTPVRAGQAGMQGAYYAQGLQRMAGGGRTSGGGVGGTASGADRGGSASGGSGEAPPGGSGPRPGPRGSAGGNGSGVGAAPAPHPGRSQGHSPASPAAPTNSRTALSTGAGMVPVGARPGTQQRRPPDSGGAR